MPYRYLEDIATADVAFEAWGDSREELFIAAADAMTNVMVENLATIAPLVEVAITLEHDQLDLLLFSLLQELVYYKDTRRLLLRISNLSLEESPQRIALGATARGEIIDERKHAMLADVKAVTLHRFRLEEQHDRWSATVVLDV